MLDFDIGMWFGLFAPAGTPSAIVSKLNAIKMANATGDIPQNVNFAINATVARGFLDAKGVKYETAPSNKKLEAADVGELAKRFTVVVECWK